MTVHVRFVVLACWLLVPAQLVHANSYGVINTTLRPGDSGNGCASCHGALPGVVDVQVQGDSGVLPGASARYSVIIDNISNASARGGFTAAVTEQGS
ncbi:MULTISPECIES: hypothetical protein [unclassified Wenzhouxiangella]|uniref:hypothetical protein n=1 Tax=unclassified Wenzhouxiangella TaxID=2613841 RepID=UPI0011C05A4D|nr:MULTISPECIES: hypothetical protein [unclassified Wenzhouxiangella]